MNFSNFYIKEFVAIPTKGEEEIKIGERKYYKSKKLNEKVKKVIEKYADKDVTDVLSKAIDKDLIIPLYIDKNIPQSILNNIRDKYRYHPRGIFRPLDKRGYIFINPKFLFVDERQIYGTIVHELMHTVNHRYPSKFISIHYNRLENFYTTFFSEIKPLMLEKKCIKPEYVRELIKKLTIIISTDHKFDEKFIENILYNIYDNFFNKSGDLCNLTNNNKYKYNVKTFKQILEFAIKKRIIHKQLYEYGKIAYEKALKIKSKTFMQELWAPSEVISVFAGVYPNNEDVKKTLLLFKI